MLTHPQYPASSELSEDDRLVMLRENKESVQKI